MQTLTEIKDKSPKIEKDVRENSDITKSNEKKKEHKKFRN